MPTFTWTPANGAKKKPKSNKVKAQFGDGYQQVQQVGVNAFSADWHLTFPHLSESDADDIEDFLTDNDTAAFYCTPPGGSAGKYRCPAENWEKTVEKGGFYTISATFEQVFEP